MDNIILVVKTEEATSHTCFLSFDIVGMAFMVITDILAEDIEKYVVTKMKMKRAINADILNAHPNNIIIVIIFKATRIGM